MAERYLYFEVKIPFDSIKTFSAALHLLHKLGRDCTIEVEQSSLTLRSLNDSKTAFGSVEFQDHYFDSFIVNETKSFSCKLALKPVCIIIRNVKNVGFITMSASRTGAEHELSFQMNLANGITRTHRLIYSDCEIMNALFEEEGCSQVKSRPGVFCQLLDHLHRSPEVCVQATPTLFTVSSYHKAGAVSGSMSIQQQKAELQRHMATGISVNIIEFDLYQFRPVTQWDTGNNDDGTEQQQGQQHQEELIFCTKEVNSFLGFCEALDLPSFDYFFTCGGRASKYACRLDGVSVSLILATIVSDRLRIQQQQQYQQAPSASAAASRSASAAAAGAASVRNGKSSSSSSSSNRSKVTSHKVRKEVEQEEEPAALPAPPRGKSNNTSSSSSGSGGGTGAGGRNNKQSASSSSSSSSSSTSAAVPNNNSSATVNANGANIFENADEMREALRLQQMFDEQKKQAAKRSNTTSSSTSSSSVGGRNKTDKTGKSSSSSSKRDSTGDISGGGNFLADSAKKNKRSNKGQEEEEAEFDEPLPAPLAVRLNSLTTNNKKKEAAVTPVRTKKGSRKSIVEEDTEEQEEQEEDSAPISMGLRSASREAAAAVSYINRYIKTEQGLGAEEEQDEWTQRNEETQQLVNNSNNGISTAVPKTVPATSTTAGASAKKNSSSRETGEKSRKSRKKRLFEDSEEDD